jgi:amino acid exporter
LRHIVIEVPVPMDALHSALLAVGLFVLTFFNPGPNLLIVVQSSLSAGRVAGIAAGVGVAVGDGFYAALGLFGMATLVTRSAEVFHAVKLLGGLYLLWCAWRLMRSHTATTLDVAGGRPARSLSRHFWRGLVTDLANVQTVLFFASIFAVTLGAETPGWAKLLSWVGIFFASLLWRTSLSLAFSQPRIRHGYERCQRRIEQAAGLMLGVFGIRLLFDGLARR